MWFSLCLSVILLRSVSCVFTTKIGLDWIYIGQETTIALSNSAIADPLRPPLPPNGGLICPQDTRMAISPQRVIRYTSCLVLGQGFQGRRIEWRYFRLHQFQVGGWSPSWIISSGHISATAYSIHLYSVHRAVIFAIAQLSCTICMYLQANSCCAFCRLY